MKKDILAVFAIILIVAAVINGTHIQSVDEYYLTHIDDITPESETVKISIRCDTILDNYDDLEPALQSDEFVPPDSPKPNMCCARAIQFLIFWTEPCAITGYKWNFRGQMKTAMGAYIFRV